MAPSADREPLVAAAILVGGRSRRMGHDKRTIVVEGRTLLERTIEAVGQVAASITLVGRDAPQPDSGGANGPAPGSPPGTRAVPDVRPGGGPLVGLETALLANPDADAVLLVGTDHPWLEPAVLQLLVDRLLGDETGADRDGAGRNVAGPNVSGGKHGRLAAGAAMLVTDRGPQPLLAAYRPSVVGAVSRLLDGCERRLRVVTDHLDVVAVGSELWRPLDPFAASAVDVDTPEELRAAQAWQARVRATAASRFGPVGQDAPRAGVVQVADGRSDRVADRLIGEEPLEVRAAGPGQEPVTLMTTLRTPGHEREQAVGWLLAEGFATPGEVVDVELGDPIVLARPDDTVTVRLTRTVDASAGAHRHALATASCGVCGRASIDELAARTAPVTGDPFERTPLPWEVLARLPDELRAAQTRFHATGGVHATGLFDASGRLVTVREDVGRHNALDAVIGAHVLAGDWPVGGLDDLICVLSGRIGFELVAKAAVARLGLVAAVGAASDLAVRTADRLGITLVGFLRDGDGTVYTHPQRLVLPAGPPGPTDPGGGAGSVGGSAEIPAERSTQPGATAEPGGGAGSVGGSAEIPAERSTRPGATAGGTRPGAGTSDGA